MGTEDREKFGRVASERTGSWEATWDRPCHLSSAPRLRVGPPGGSVHSYRTGEAKGQS